MKNIILCSILALGISGCSKTWSGIKQDSSELFTDTKEVIHNATAPAYIPPAQSIARPAVSTNQVQQAPTSAPTVISPVGSSNPVKITTPTVSTESNTNVNVAPATARECK